MQLDQKVAFVTGAGRGIGRAIARTFAREGCAVACAARTAEEIEKTVRGIVEAGGRALAVVCDVTNPADVHAGVTAARVAFGPIDILVNNAGGAPFRPFAEITREEWMRVIDLNLHSAFTCIQAVLPEMMARRTGRIINVSSVTGLKAIVNQSAYCSAKHALNGLTKSLALELRPHCIAVHAICPGGVDTQLSREVMPERDKTGWLQPEDVAHAALFLATQSAEAATDILELRRFGGEPLAR